jgi:hypothetical protein
VVSEGLPITTKASPADVHLLVIHAYQRLGEMAASDRRHLVVASIQIAGEEPAHAALGMGLAAAAAVPLTFACGLHASLALWTEGHNILLSLCQMEDVELLQVERSLSHRAVDLQLIA